MYQQQLKDMIIGHVGKEGSQRDRPLEGMKVVVNAGNGMGGFLADTLAEVRKTPCPETRTVALDIKSNHGTVVDACYVREGYN